MSDYCVQQLKTNVASSIIPIVTNQQSSLIVELFLDRARVIGLIPNVSQNRRLVDVLGNQDLSIELEQAEARLVGGNQSYRFSRMSLKKADVLFAIPRETPDQLRARALYRTGMSTQSQVAMPLGVLLSTCHIAGTTYVSPSMGRQKLEVASFPHFFAITDASITQPDGSSTLESVVIVNRDSILAVGRPDET